MSNENQTLRIDCPDCRGNGYKSGPTGESMCEKCGGSGLLEKEVPYKFETRGRWSKEEIANQFGVDPEKITDRGHSAGEDAPFNG